MYAVQEKKPQLYSRQSVNNRVITIGLLHARADAQWVTHTRERCSYNV